VAARTLMLAMPAFPTIEEIIATYAGNPDPRT